MRPASFTQQLTLVLIPLSAMIGCNSSGATAEDPDHPSSASIKPESSAPSSLSLLFIGNSHTAGHDLPNLVRRMIEFRRPGENVLVAYIPVAFLEDLKNNSAADAKLAERRWSAVILQAQKISQSGRFDYSKQEAIDVAKRARAAGSRAIFYPEWGLRGVKGDAQRIEKVYAEMARAADAELAPVGRAWDLAQADRKDLALYEADGNHQSETGAYLTACVLFAAITGDDPSRLNSLEGNSTPDADRIFFQRMAAEALRQPPSARLERP